MECYHIQVNSFWFLHSSFIFMASCFKIPFWVRILCLTQATSFRVSFIYFPNSIGRKSLFWKAPMRIIISDSVPILSMATGWIYVIENIKKKKKSQLWEMTISTSLPNNPRPISLRIIGIHNLRFWSSPWVQLQIKLNMCLGTRG